MLFVKEEAKDTWKLDFITLRTPPSREKMLVRMFLSSLNICKPVNPRSGSSNSGVSQVSERKNINFIPTLSN